jgi:hypothetical protein
MPSAVCTGYAEVQQGLIVFWLPPGTGQCEVFLNDIAMYTLHVVRTDRSSGLKGCLVVELSRAMGPDRCFFRRHGVLLLERHKHRQDHREGVDFQRVVLSLPPARIVGCSNFGRSEVVAPVEKST